MTAYTPSYKVLIDSVEVTDVTIANLTVTSGRTDINTQPIAGYCQVQLMNLDNSSYNFTVGTGITVEVTNSSGSYVPIFGGFISDFTIGVNRAGSIGYTTIATITALGALSKLPRIIDPGVLSQDFILQFLRSSSAIPVKPFTTGRNKVHPEFGVESIAAEMAAGKWVIPNRDGRMHSEVEALVNEMLYYDPKSHTGDRLMALWFAREAARQGNIRAEVGYIPTLRR